MNSKQACRTLWLAAKVLGSLRAPRDVLAGPWSKNPSFLNEVRSLADEAGGAGVQLLVAVFGEGPEPDVLDLGTKSPSAPHSVADDSFPRGAPPPRFGRVLLLTIDGEGPLNAALRIELFEDGRRHGFQPGCPAGVEASVDGFSAGYYYRDMDVSDLGVLELTSIRNLDTACTGGARALIVDPRHEAAFVAIVSAENRGEAVAISAASLPGLNFVRPSGGTKYQLADDLLLNAARKDWEARGAAALSVRIHHEGGAQKCSVVRKVGPLVDGAGPMSPGVCSTTFRGADGPVSTLLAWFRRGRRLAGPERDPDPAPPTFR